MYQELDGQVHSLQQAVLLFDAVRIRFNQAVLVAHHIGVVLAVPVQRIETDIRARFRRGFAQDILDRVEVGVDDLVGDPLSGAQVVDQESRLHAIPGFQRFPFARFRLPEFNTIANEITRFKERRKIFQQIARRRIFIRRLRHALFAHEGRVDDGRVQQQIVQIVIGAVVFGTVTVLLREVYQRTAGNAVFTLEAVPLAPHLGRLVLGAAPAPLIPNLKGLALGFESHAGFKPGVIVVGVNVFE